MKQSPPLEISALLRAWSGGDESALARLMPIVYGELHQLAHSYMKRERSGHTLQTTALRDWNMAKLWLLKELKQE